jgi:hypothetical protein
MAKNNSFSLPGAKNLPDEISAATFQQLLKKKNAGTFIPDAKKMLCPREENVQVSTTVHPSEGFFIPGNVPSKKRAYKPIWVHNKSGGQRHMGLMKHDHIIKYEQESGPHWAKYAQDFRELIGVERPVYVQMYFVRSTVASRWDFNNLSQMVCDQMVEHGWIEDDNIDSLIAVPPFDMPKWIKDNNNPGVLIKKLNIKYVDKYVINAIKEDQESLAKLTNFIALNHPDMIQAWGKNSVEIAIVELKKLWKIL